MKEITLNKDQNFHKIIDTYTSVCQRGRGVDPISRTSTVSLQFHALHIYF